MSHVHWPLFALSFVIGLAFTLVLTIRRMKREAVVGPSVEEAEPPTALVETEADSATTVIAPETAPEPEPPTTEMPVAAEAPTTRVPAAKRPAKRTPPDKGPRTRKIPVAPYAPYGPGSARPRADGSGPAGWFVKGRSDTRLYYTPDDPVYDRTVAQVWFKDTQSAARAFFTPWRWSTKKH
jgi:uncharacterized membrane protein ArfC